MRRSDSCKAECFFGPGFDLLPLRLGLAGTLGVLTTNEDRDLSFLLAGNGIEHTASGAPELILLEGKSLNLSSRKLLSPL